jgi:RNA polymerase subunit RPABC4/transcription elongation factor Spt4
METQPCPHCGELHPKSARFCPNTGQEIPLITVCPQCKRDFEPGWKACPYCGALISQAGQSSFSYPVTYYYPDPKKRLIPRWLVGLIVILSFLVIIYFGIFYFLGFHRTNQAAKILPSDTTALITFSPSPLQLTQLRNAENLEDIAFIFGAIPGLVEVGTSAQNDLPLDINLQEDILPWIGRETSIAVLPDHYKEVTGRSIGYDPPVLLTIATRNKRSSDRFIDKLRTQLEGRGIEFNNTNYQGTEITEVALENTLDIYYATFENMIVVANYREVLQDSIDRSMGQGMSTLYDLEAYWDVEKSLPNDRIGMVYLDISDLVRELYYENEEIPLASSVLGIGTIGAAVRLESEGVGIEYVLVYDQDHLTEFEFESLRLPALSGSVVNQMPFETMFILSGQQLSISWENLKQSLFWENTQAIQRDIEREFGLGSRYDSANVDFIESLADISGVHLENDILDHFTGEYAWLIAEDPTSVFKSRDLGLGFLLAVELDEPVLVERKLRQLIEFFLQREGIHLNQDNMDGVTVWYFQDLDQGSEWSFGVYKDTIVFGSSRRALEMVIRDDHRRLSDNPTYQKAGNSSLGKRNRFLYLDMNLIKNLIEPRMQYSEAEEISKYLDPIQSISFSSEPIDSNGLVHGQIYFHTK